LADRLPIAGLITGSKINSRPTLVLPGYQCLLAGSPKEPYLSFPLRNKFTLDPLKIPINGLSTYFHLHYEWEYVKSIWLQMLPRLAYLKGYMCRNAAVIQIHTNLSHAMNEMTQWDEYLHIDQVESACQESSSCKTLWK
jgi:hypothetical protein